MPPRRLKQDLLEDWDYKFLINLNPKDVLILDHLNNNFTNIGKLMTNPEYEIILSRGVELSKTGKVVFCEKCKKFIPIPKKALMCKACNSKLNPNEIETIFNLNDYSPIIFLKTAYPVCPNGMKIPDLFLTKFVSYG